MTIPEITYENKYKALDINTDKQKKQGCYTNQLESQYKQLTAITNHYSKVTLIRFDLHLPKSHDPDNDGKVIRRFWNLLSTHLKTKTKQKNKKPYRNHSKIAYSWVLEIEAAKQAHYHCWIAVDGSKIQRSGTTESWSGTNSGIMGLVYHYWNLASKGGTTPSFGNPVHHINRADKSSLNDAFYRISYFSKIRGKSYGKKKYKRNFGSSKLPAAF